MIKALVIPVGSPARVEEISGDLRSLQKLVGGYLEAVHLDWEGTHVYVNEEGRLRQMPVNLAATALAQQSGKLPLDTVLVGPVVVLGGHLISGNEADCPQHVIDMILG